ncbi:MAG TPA: AMP-binding protein [Acidimicrobiia bacterium]|nr:AMP-binding protein [Acidimicrobiia bacterium]
MAADGFGERVAIGVGGEGVTFAEVRDRSAAVAARLGPSRPKVALLGETSPLVPVALFGAAWAGVPYAPINYRLPAETRDALLARLAPVEVADDAWLDPSTGAPEPFPDSPAAPAVLLFTSGTTAEPKAATLGHDQLLAYIFNTVEFAGAGEGEAVLVAVPPFHIAGVAAMLSSTYAGRRVVPLPHFSPEAWLDLTARERVTHAFVVPTMLARIVAQLEQDPDVDVSSLRHLAYGGSRMPTPILERALTLFPDAAFVNAYGLTETSSTVCMLGPDDHRAAQQSTDPTVRARLGSVGRPVPGVEVRIVEGEVQVRGDQVSGEYVGQGSRRDAGGWLQTGDRGHVDADGYVFVEGRGDDTIIRGGENLAPAEIEDTLLRHPAVAGAAVVGLPDEEWGELVAAMVVARPGAAIDPEALRAHVHEHLGSLKTPEVLVVADELPHTATGKVLRREVRAGLAQRS